MTVTSDVFRHESLPTVPSRYRSDEKRSMRLGKVLRHFAGVKELDEQLMERLAEGFMQKDELGAELARAMRLPADHPERVTMAQFQLASAEGIAAIDDPPPALRAFFDVVDSVPDWVDWDLVEEGGRVGRRLGQNAADVLMQLSLLGGYRFGGPTDLLVATGGLAGDMTRRRLGETQKWTVAVSQPDAMRREGEGLQLTLHVRVMHALVNETFTPRWDVARWGVPINQSDQAATLGLFSGVLVLGSRAMNVRITPEESRAVMHLWKYIGWLMGVDDAWLVDTEKEQHRLNYHVLIAQAGISEAGPRLAQAIVEAQNDLHFDRGARLGRWMSRERLLSMMTTLLGPRSMREFGLPLRPPWALAYVLVLNTVRYRIIGRTAWGERVLQRWGDRVRRRVMYRHFGPDRPEIGALGV
ncbi:MAG: oxygenase MpaB family protein [Aeromicrobium sp.]